MRSQQDSLRAQDRIKHQLDVTDAERGQLDKVRIMNAASVATETCVQLHCSIKMLDHMCVEELGYMRQGMLSFETCV